MKNKTNIRIVAGLFLGVLLISTACQSDDPAEPTVEKETTRISVEAVVVSTTDIAITRTYSGALKGEQQADIRSKLTESVTEIHVAEGDRVVANQLLIGLDPYGSSSRFTEVQSVYLNSEKNFKKMTYLYNEGAVSEADFDATHTQYEVDKAGFEAVSRMVNVQTPIAGVVTSIDVSVGESVSPGQKLATVASTEKLRVIFGVNSDDVIRFQKGAKVLISSELTDHTASGEVVSTARSANTDTRAFQVEAMVDNRVGELRPGMFVRVDYITQSLVDVIVIDRAAVVVLDDGPVAFVVTDGKATRRSLTLGDSMDGQQVILSGLTVGDTLVTVGQAYLDDGLEVNLTRLHE